MKERVFHHNNVTARLICGDCREVLPIQADAVITDPPYSERTHSGHDSSAPTGNDGAVRKTLGYSALTPEQIPVIASMFHGTCSGWVVWMTDSELAHHIRGAFDRLGRCTFAPLPFYAPGSRVRLSGDGPSSWTDWIMVSRTKKQARWGTLPGGYAAREGWKDKVHMGGKPSRLMQHIVKDYSREGETVLDPYMGSGTTGIACLRTGRNFIGVEIDPTHFETACARMERECQQPMLL